MQNVKKFALSGSESGKNPSKSETLDTDLPFLEVPALAVELYQGPQLLHPTNHVHTPVLIQRPTREMY